MRDTLKVQRVVDDVVKSYRKVAIYCIGGLILTSMTSIICIYKYFEKSSAQVYLARDYSGVERILDQRAMINQHVKNFYSLFFEADQSSFKSRTEDALYLVGQSGVDLRNRFSEAGWYRQIVLNNVILTVDIDSIGIDMEKYPYEVTVLARQNVKRESAFTTRYLNSKFTVTKVGNSDKNPFGLRIDKFIITDNRPYVPTK